MKISHETKTLIKANIFALVIFSLIVLSGSVFKESNTVIGADSLVASAVKADEDNISPEKLYSRVWELIKKDYVDQTFNGQDWNIWRDRYRGNLKTLDDAHKGIETMLVSLGDRYTRFLSKKDFDDEKQAINAKLTGIGIQIGLDKSQRLIVIAPIDGTPAHKAGLMPGDEITEINGEPTKGISVEEAATQIKGPIGTEVTLTIGRGKDSLEKIITRAKK